MKGQYQHDSSLTVRSAQHIAIWSYISPAFTLVSSAAYFSTLKMEAISSSETSVDTQRTTRRYIPEDGTIYIAIIVTC
jgi:hypothetical protein